jgi:hypothetical protein
MINFSSTPLKENRFCTPHMPKILFQQPARLRRMARGPCTFKQRDVTRALRAAVAAGVQVSRFEIDKDGRIIVVTENGSTDDNDVLSNEWDGAQ